MFSEISSAMPQKLPGQRSCPELNQFVAYGKKDGEVIDTGRRECQGLFAAADPLSPLAWARFGGAPP